MLGLKTLLGKADDPSKCSYDDLRLNEFFDGHFYPHVELTKPSHKEDVYIFNRQIRDKVGHVRLKDLDNAVLDEWLRAQVKTGYKPATINKHIFLMNRMMNVARHWGFIDYNTFENRMIKRLPTGDYVQRFLSEQEIAALLNACRRDQHPFLYHFVRLLLLTGARKGEARHARWRDIDRAKQVWTVPVAKGGRSRRIVLSQAALEVLDETRAQADRLYLPHDGRHYIFINPKTRTRYDSFYSSWYRVRERAELPTVRFHDLRHTYASLLVNKGVSIYEVQTLLGHHHVSMTERYAHLAPNTLQRRVEIVSGTLDEIGI